MKIIAINGSPRRNWNTATLLQKALEGASTAGASTQLEHLYSLKDYKGCRSCFSCKLAGGASYGKCAVQDGLTPMLELARESDAVIIGSPIYCADVTSATRALLERMIFPVVPYSKERKSLLGKKIPIGLVFTMGAPAASSFYKEIFANIQNLMKNIYGPCSVMASFDTYQFDDYGKYESSLFDVAAKERVRKEQFPQDCRSAFEFGRKLAETAKTLQ